MTTARAALSRLGFRSDQDLHLVATVALGFLAAVALGTSVARYGPVAAAVGAFLGLLAASLRFPALPFWLTLGLFAIVAAHSTDNPLLTGAEVVYVSLPGVPVGPADLLIAASVVGALSALTRMGHTARRQAWTPLSGPVLALAASGLFVSLVIHGEGTAGVEGLTPTLRFTVAFLVTSVLMAARLVSSRSLLLGSVLVAQAVGLFGIYNALVGGEGATLASEAAGGDERSLAFFDAASPFVLVIALAVVVTLSLWTTVARRGLLALLAVLPFLGLLLSVRRAMWLDFTVAIVLIAAVSARSRIRTLAPALLIVLAVAVGLGGLAQSSPVYRERVDSLGSLFTGGSSEANIRSREIETSAAWRNIRRSPIAGIGITTPYASNVQFQFQVATYLHNNFLWVWLKLGLLGLLALSWLVLATARSGLRATRGLGRTVGLSEPQAALASTGVALGFFVAITTASFLTASSRFPVLAAVVLAIPAIIAARSEHRPPA